jgi:intracellular sulfur oxidation DsrE/DsrF family protein
MTTSLKCLLPLVLLFAAAPALAHAQVASHAPAPGQAEAATHHIVFALVSGDETDWKLTLGNLRNMLIAYPAGSAELELVAYGPGLGFLRKGSIAEAEIETLEAKHVHFVACENSMRAQKVTPADLTAGVTQVPSGIVEIVNLQEHGWSYIKAGR